MLEQILLRDFQAHDIKRISFDDRVTTITGPSDAGKSSILRAIRWAAQNVPQGEGFIRAGEEESEVTIWANGAVVQRTRGKNNTYELNGDEFVAFGTGVPQPVSDALSIGDVNFQDQHDGPFWLCLSAGEVSRQLNALVDLDIIDRALQNIGKEVRRAGAAVDVCESMVKEAEEKRANLAWVEEARNDTERLTKLAGEWSKKFKCYNELSRLLEGVREIQRGLSLSYDRIKDMVAIGKIGQDAINADFRIEALQDEIELIEICNDKLNEPIYEVIDFDDLITDYEVKAAYLKDASASIEAVKKHNKEFNVLCERAEELEDQLIELTGGRCPVCGKEMV